MTSLWPQPPSDHGANRGSAGDVTGPAWQHHDFGARRRSSAAPGRRPGPVDHELSAGAARSDRSAPPQFINRTPGSEDDAQLFSAAGSDQDPLIAPHVERRLSSVSKETQAELASKLTLEEVIGTVGDAIFGISGGERVRQVWVIPTSGVMNGALLSSPPYDVDISNGSKFLPDDRYDLVSPTESRLIEAVNELLRSGSSVERVDREITLRRGRDIAEFFNDKQLSTVGTHNQLGVFPVDTSDGRAAFIIVLFQDLPSGDLLTRGQIRRIGDAFAERVSKLRAG